MNPAFKAWLLINGWSHPVRTSCRFLKASTGHILVVFLHQSGGQAEIWKGSARVARLESWKDTDSLESFFSSGAR